MRADPCGEREWDEGEPGRERPPAEDVLEVERAQEEEPEDRAGCGEHQEEPSADSAIGQSVDPQERCLGAALEGREEHDAGETTEAEEVRLDRRPTPPSACVIAKTIAPRLVGASTAPRRSRPFPARLLGVGRDDLQSGDRERCCDGEVDVEDHPPVGELGQDAAGEDADRSACAADGSPGSERLRALVAVERGHDDRERCRGEHRGAETLARASREEGAGGPAIAEANEEAVKMPRPVRNIRRRPSKSAARPPKRSRLPKIRE